MKDQPFELTDIVRETSYAIHRYHGCGHLEKVYEHALVHRFRSSALKSSNNGRRKGTECCRKKRKKMAGIWFYFFRPLSFFSAKPPSVLRLS